MKNYYYVHTGHRIGLDRFRRAVTIVKELQKKMEITLLCSDFRIAHEARHFGIDLCVGVDIVRNIPYIANHGDRLIFDSDEANPIMLEDMKQFFSKFVHIDNSKPVVDEKYFIQTPKTIKLALFFGDDDYEKDLEKNLDILDGLDIELLLGFYYFLDYEEMLKTKFKKFHQFEDYDKVITTSEVLITSSPQAVLECLASGGKPIYLQREDYPDDFTNLYELLNIPIIQNFNKTLIEAILGSIDGNNYQSLKKNLSNLNLL
ncbi:MAG: hypothetical protein L3I99_02520 [Sulfurimonas sp.]|nr:hypothetical protein [Sulfurimonas sp.]